MPTNSSQTFTHFCFRLRPEGAEQDILDQERITKAGSIRTLNEDESDQGCLPFKCLGNNNFTLDVRRKPISALAANSFWSGVSEIKDVLISGNPLLETSRFYVEDEPSEEEILDNRKESPDPDHFFNDINTLYQRQTALFQRSCEQLKDLYHIQEQDLDPVKFVEDHQADANVSEFVLKEPGFIFRPSSNSQDDTITTNSSELGKTDNQEVNFCKNKLDFLGFFRS